MHMNNFCVIHIHTCMYTLIHAYVHSHVTRIGLCEQLDSCIDVHIYMHRCTHLHA